MGKKQHQRDKLYLTSTEWSVFYGGKKAAPLVGDRAEFRRLPFFCCSLSMQPFENPYCTKAGTIFDIENILPFLKQFGVNPATGEKLAFKELIKLNFFKNSNDKYHCPVTFKVFNENTHIVAIKTSGNVLSYDAVERLNIKPSFWKDLITDEPFVRNDIIEIQNPANLDKFNLANFYHVRKRIQVHDKDEEAAKKNPRYNLNSVNAETQDILDELDRTYKAPEKVASNKAKADSTNAAHYSTGMVAASFTSTAMTPATEHEAAIIDEDVIRYERIHKKTYLRMNTSHGSLNFELHSDMVPKTCDNFLRLCLSGYYNGTIFHRSLRNFMIQGGDPDGTGLGGQSVWGAPFKDELKPNLTHSGRGILSMANSGPNTNKSQFFVTYRSARHLDTKHSVFGRVVGGLETLDKMEAVETDSKDRPKKTIQVINCEVFVNPYAEADEMLKKEREEVILKKETEETATAQRLSLLKKPAVSVEQKVFKSEGGVGQFVNIAMKKRALEETEGTSSRVVKRKREVTTELKNFSSWA